MAERRMGQPGSRVSCRHRGNDRSTPHENDEDPHPTGGAAARPPRRRNVADREDGDGVVPEPEGHERVGTDVEVDADDVIDLRPAGLAPAPAEDDVTRES